MTITMETIIKNHLYGSANANQAVMSYLELGDYAKALLHTEESIAEMTAVSVLLAHGLSDGQQPTNLEPAVPVAGVAPKDTSDRTKMHEPPKAD